MDLQNSPRRLPVSSLTLMITSSSLFCCKCCHCSCTLCTFTPPAPTVSVVRLLMATPIYRPLQRRGGGSLRETLIHFQCADKGGCPKTYTSNWTYDSLLPEICSRINTILCVWREELLVGKKTCYGSKVGLLLTCKT